MNINYCGYNYGAIQQLEKRKKCLNSIYVREAEKKSLL